MRSLWWAVAGAMALGLVVVEAAMQPTRADRLHLYALFAGMSLLTLGLGVLLARRLPRTRRLGTAIRWVVLSSVVVAIAGVVVSAQTMFISTHDRNLVLIALGLGVALGLALAVVVASSFSADLARLASTTRRVGAGDLSARAEVRRADELGAAASAFDEMVARLERTEAARAHLFASIGHDLRTPLASLQASVEALEDGLAADPGAYLRGMAKDLEDLRRLVDDVFLLARIEAGSMELRPEPVDLAELADEAAEAMAALAAKRRVLLGVETDGAVDAVVDPSAIGRVLRNLIDNAVHHSPEGGRVRITVGSGRGTATVRVLDEGPGFPEEFREVAFERFSRADQARSRRAGGAGLGLAIARGLVEAHRGRISIEEGDGGRVRVELPAP